MEENFLKEESFKSDLLQIIAHYSQKEGMTIGTQYYILKDVFHDIEKTYQDYINKIILEQQEKLKEENKTEEQIEEVEE